MPQKKMAKQVFQRLAEAEALVHGTTVDKIHFHEVGAMDSIVDIVGSCLALEVLDVDEVTFAPKGSRAARFQRHMQPALPTCSRWIVCLQNLRSFG